MLFVSIAVAFAALSDALRWQPAERARCVARALSLAEAAYGSDHFRLAPLLIDAGRAQASDASLPAAQREQGMARLRQALAILQRKFGSEAAETLPALRALIPPLLAGRVVGAKEATEAEPLVELAVRVAGRHAGLVSGDTEWAVEQWTKVEHSACLPSSAG